MNILWYNNLSGTNAVWHMNAVFFPNTPGLVAYLPSAAGANWEIVATADFNRISVRPRIAGSRSWAILRFD